MPVLTLIFTEQFKIFSRRLRTESKVVYSFEGRTSIKNIIESVGVPHTEIGRIEVQKQPVNFQYIPVQSDTVTIFPIFPPFDINSPSILRPRPLKDALYLVDVNVGKLAGLMRVVGLDTAYSSACGDDQIAIKAEKENRIVLSKDIGLLKRKRVVYGRFIRAVHPADQLKEVVDFFGLAGRLRPFSRCIRCNTELLSVDKKKIEHRLEPKTRAYFHRFKQCMTCNRLYWRGSHHGQMQKWLQNAGITVNQTTIF